MGKNVSLFDLVSSVIDGENMRRLEAGFLLDKEKVDILRDYCSAIEGMLNESDKFGYSCSILENGRIEVSAEVDSITLDGRQCIMKDLIDRSCKFNIKTGIKGESVIVTFVFPSVWGGRIR